MKILACHIENFGKLHDVSFSFSDGINPIREKNGWGKSTLAAFIRVMLYGFTNERTRDDFTNERRRFAPWQGGVYGGTLTFSAESGVYTVSRVFGSKEKEDVFSLRDAQTNLPSDRFSAQLGEELFLMDRDSFVRTVFLTQNDCRTEATDGVNAKIGNLTELGGDMSRYAKTDARLHELLNEMSPRRKTGSLSRRKEEISMLTEAVRKKETVTTAIDTLAGKKKAEEEKLRKLQVQRSALQNVQQRLAAYQDAKARLAAYGTLQEEVKTRAQQVAAEEKAFGDTVPTAAQLTDCTDRCTQLMGEEKLLQACLLTDAETEALAQLREKFARGMRMQAGERTDSAAAADRMQPTDGKEMAEGEKALEATSAAWLDARAHALKNTQLAQKKKMRRLGVCALLGAAIGLVLLLIGALTDAGGIWLLLAGTVLLAVGPALLACAYCLQKKNAAHIEQEQEALRLLRDDADRLQTLADKEAAYFAQQEKCRALSGALQKNACALFPAVSAAQDAALIQNAEEMFDFLQEKRAQLQHYARTKEELAKTQKSLAGLVKQETADKLRAIVTAYEANPNAPRDAEALQLRQAAFMEECERVQACIAGYARQTDDLMQQEEEILKQEEALEEQKADYEKEKIRYATIERTQKYLQQAKTNLTARYMQPLLKSFGVYYRLLTGEEPTAYRMDANTQLAVEAYGNWRDIRFLSAGLGDLTGICLRLALVDAMYPDEKPFLVLDDPFVNLDSEKRGRAKKLLDTLAARYQILYFTCN